MVRAGGSRTAAVLLAPTLRPAHGHGPNTHGVIVASLAVPWSFRVQRRFLLPVAIRSRTTSPVRLSNDMGYREHIPTQSKSWKAYMPKLSRGRPVNSLIGCIWGICVLVFLVELVPVYAAVALKPIKVVTVMLWASLFASLGLSLTRLWKTRDFKPAGSGQETSASIHVLH